MTTGRNTAATQVMIRRVYGAEEALAVVRLYAGSMVDGSTFGNRAVNSAATASPIAPAVPAKAQPSRPARFAASPATSASAAATASSRAAPRASTSTIVQPRNATATTAVTGPSRRTSRSARRLTSPRVLRATNTAPWVRNRPRVVAPPSNAYGLSRSSRSPAYSPLASTGTPRTMLANATPHSTAGTSDPATSAQSHRARQAGSSRLPRYSKATPRTINAIRITSSGR